MTGASADNLLQLIFYNIDRIEFKFTRLGIKQVENIFDELSDQLQVIHKDFPE